jgi:hypothetical protein
VSRAGALPEAIGRESADEATMELSVPKASGGQMCPGAHPCISLALPLAGMVRCGS